MRRDMHISVNENYFNNTVDERPNPAENFMKFELDFYFEKIETLDLSDRKVISVDFPS